MKISIQSWLASFSGVLVAIVTLTAITGAAFASGGELFTPGSLSTISGDPLGGVTSHSQIEQCSACHSAPWEIDTMSDRCLSCHTDITAQLEDPASLHSMVQFGGLDLDCRSCHTEHHGPEASLTRIAPGWDPHDQLGFSLKAHRLMSDGTPFECNDCHINGYSGPFDQEVCANCHLNLDPVFAQEHILTFWTDCQACHDGIDTHGSDFDHNQVAFPLLGIHALTACSQCHINARNLEDLQATAQDCYACHAKDDQHEGRFGTKCGVCHNPEGWGKSAQFDHELANFKLRGKHTTVPCADCHKNNIYKGIPSDCFSCHEQDDKHQGSLGTQCELCHVAEGWNRAVDHSKFAFPLEGSHVNVPCESCHIDAVFAGTPMQCVDCHKQDDAHNGRFGTRCEECHTPKDWTSATFDHNTVAFKLASHQRKSDGSAFGCRDCHVKNYAMPFDQAVCADCHLKVDQAFTSEHILTFWTNCMACHDGVETLGSDFDHNRYPFNLEGKHAAVACSSCHINDRNVSDLRATPKDCYTCHQKDDFHKGQFGTDCAACHSPNAWKPVKVDHSKFAFKLDGQHASVTCESCHKNGVFKGTPMGCVSCHSADDAHNGQLGTDCAACHSVNGWKPASVDHSKFAFKLDGQHASASCTDCHKNNDFKNTPTSCVSCHSADDAHNGQLGTECAACHSPSGWKPANVDHSKFAFKLDGQHASASCTDCHKNNDFKNTPTSCVSCHSADDAHNGQLGTECAACHSPGGWKPANVDHSKFAFKLDGQHASASCTDCHKNNVFKGTPMDCASCHIEDDAHNGDFGTSCDSCHTPAGWSPAAFDHNTTSFKLTSHQKKSDNSDFACKDCHVQGYASPFDQDTCGNCHLQMAQAWSTDHFLTFGTNCMACHDGVESLGESFDHNKVTFQLSGKHAPVVCSSCHVNARTTSDLKNTSQACISCHAQDDHHNGQFGTDCAACHSTDGWENARVDHSKFAFHLDGKHADVSCESCHINGVFKGTPQDCVSCHLQDDHHNGQFGTNCAGCHTPDGWGNAKVDHSKFAFNLDGQHTSVACESCHVNGVFKGMPKDCVSCHLQDDHHNGQFGTECSACHSTSGWKPAAVDHSRFAFHLDGKHADVNCESCHVNGVFKGTPQDCVSCHLQDDHHNGQFGTDCAACHTPDGWANARVDHSKFAFPLDGKHANVNCESCHVNGVFKGTPMDCAACHIEDDAHSGTFGTSCGTCHSPNGWSPAVFDHNTTSFRLSSHRAHSDGSAFACKDCHVKDFAMPFDQDACGNCHLKIDLIFSASHFLTFGTNCMACHDGVESFGQNFDHNQASFGLFGKHSGLSCNKCHMGARTMSDLKGTPQACFTCHATDDHHNGQFGTNCVACHTPDGWENARVDHSKFAFHLDGQHATVACDACHKNGVFQGTPKDCVSCHLQDDHHNGQFGTDCAACHTPDSWANAKVDHSKFAFHLDGQHATVACESCHKNGVFKGTPQDCASCHSADDAHQGTYGTQCATCHNPSGWSPASFDHNTTRFVLTAHQTTTCKECHAAGFVSPFNQNTCGNCHLALNAAFSTDHFITFGTNCIACHDGVDSHGSSFDHNQVPFKLLGKHAPVACSSCHVGARNLHDLKATSQECFSCHAQDDHHNGQFGTNCAGCHTPDGWENARVDHSQFAFRLEGLHANVTCESCHVGGVFKGTPMDCASCHSDTDPHGGSLGTQCQSCHTANGWKPASFDHNTSIFKLTGKHGTVACAGCHTDLKFKGTPTTCLACHSDTDPHGGSLGSSCESCHTTGGWTPANFDHNRSIFPLTGSHTSVLCSKCHVNQVFKGTPTACSSCHTDPHSNALGTQCTTCHTTSAWKPSSFNHNNSTFKLTGAHTSLLCSRCHTDLKFKGTTPNTCYGCHAANDRHGGKYGTNCGACHSTAAWKPATFDHNLSSFPLTGAHNSVACVSCHINNVFDGTPTSCNSCHSSDDPHAGKAGTNCESCHTTTAWRPSTLRHTFPLTHGNNPVTKCSTCHPSGPSSYTCFGCHEHTVTNMAEKHREERNYSPTNCAACHPDGND